MAFYAANFIYDSVISSEYGLHITSGDGDSNWSAASVELHTQSIYRRPRNYLLGVQQTPVLSIPVQINVPVELSAEESAAVSSWLFGQMNYKKLQIIQSDMQYVYFNCIFTSPQLIRVGNIIRGFSSTIVCDSPFAWEFPKTTTYSYNANGYMAYEDITMVNSSDNPDYTYPTISFTMNNIGGGLTITNNSDTSGSSSREFIFTGLSAGEVITVNNDYQLITSSTGTNRLSNFNYKWLRYVPKANELHVEGNISSLSFTNQFARKFS